MSRGEERQVLVAWAQLYKKQRRRPASMTVIALVVLAAAVAAITMEGTRGRR